LLLYGVVANQHIIQHTTERINIGKVVNAVTVCLFGTHIAVCANSLSDCKIGVMFQIFYHAKIEQAGFAVGSNHNVVRLNVAVYIT